MDKVSQSFEFALAFDGRGFERGLGRARDSAGRFARSAVADVGKVSAAFGKSLSGAVSKSARPMTKLSSSARAAGVGMRAAGTGARFAAGGVGMLSTAVSASLGPLAALSAAFAAFQGLKSIIADASAFETKMAEVATLVPNVPVAQLGEDLRDFAATMGIDGVEAAEALYDAISKGRSPAEALEFIKTASTLAVGGVSSLKEATELLGGTMNSMGAGIEDASRITDILFTTVKNGSTTIPELSSSMSKVTETARQAGQSLEQTTGVIAALTGPGTSTAEAVTQLKNLIAGFAKPTNTASAAAAKLGFDLSAAALRSQGLELTMAKLRDALAKATSEGRDQTTVLNELFPSLEAAQAAAVLTGSGFEKMKKSIDDANNSAGAAAQAAKTVQDATGNKLKVILQSASNELSKLGAAFLEGVDAAIEWAGGVENIRLVFRDMRVWFVATVKGIRAGFDQISGSIGAVKAVLAEVSEFWSLTIAGMREGWNALAKAMAGDFKGAAASAKNSIDFFGIAAQKAFDDIPGAYRDAFNAIVNDAKTAGRVAGDTFDREWAKGLAGGGSKISQSIKNAVADGVKDAAASSGASGPGGRLAEQEKARRDWIEAENKRIAAEEQLRAEAYDRSIAAERAAAASRFDATRSFEAQRLAREAAAADDRLRLVEAQAPRMAMAMDRAFAGAVSASAPGLQNRLSNVIASVAFGSEAEGRRAFTAAERQLQRSGSFNVFAGRGAAGLSAEDVSRYLNPTTFFAAGGGVAERSGISGTGDKVPAMLDPREFVVSPGPAMAFRPQLEAINAGRAAPAVTNVNRSQDNRAFTNNVTVQTTGSADQIADAVMRKIKRANRLGLM